MAATPTNAPTGPVETISSTPTTDASPLPIPATVHFSYLFPIIIIIL
jgi:hypothetical protein